MIAWISKTLFKAPKVLALKPLFIHSGAGVQYLLKYSVTYETTQLAWSRLTTSLQHKISNIYSHSSKATCWIAQGHNSRKC